MYFFLKVVIVYFPRFPFQGKIKTTEMKVNWYVYSYAFIMVLFPFHCIHSSAFNAFLV